MTLTTFANFLLAIAVVVGLLALLAWGGRRLGMIPGVSRRGGRNRRIQIVEVAPVDAKRRLLLVRRDDVEHLVLLGIAGDLVLETVGGQAAAPARDVSGDASWLDG